MCQLARNCSRFFFIMLHRSQPCPIQSKLCWISCIGIVHDASGLRSQRGQVIHSSERGHRQCPMPCFPLMSMNCPVSSSPAEIRTFGCCFSVALNRAGVQPLGWGRHAKAWTPTTAFGSAGALPSLNWVPARRPVSTADETHGHDIRTAESAVDPH